MMDEVQIKQASHHCAQPLMTLIWMLFMAKCESHITCIVYSNLWRLTHDVIYDMKQYLYCLYHFCINLTFIIKSDQRFHFKSLNTNNIHPGTTIGYPVMCLLCCWIKSMHPSTELISIHDVTFLYINATLFRNDC